MKSAIKTNNNRDLMAAALKRRLAFTFNNEPVAVLNKYACLVCGLWTVACGPGKRIYSFIKRRQLSTRNFVEP